MSGFEDGFPYSMPEPTTPQEEELRKKIQRIVKEPALHPKIGGNGYRAASPMTDQVEKLIRSEVTSVLDRLEKVNDNTGKLQLHGEVYKFLKAERSKLQ